MVRALPHVSFPNPQHLEPASGHVGILRTIKRYSSFLTFTRFWEAGRVSVPIVAIKLNDEIQAWRECVHAEFPANKKLLLVGNACFVKQSIAKLFEVIGPHFSLLNIHADKHFPTLRVSIPAWQRTISRLALLAARWRPLKTFTADFAGELFLIASLPFIGVFLAAKEILRLPPLRKRNVYPAHSAGGFDPKSSPIGIATGPGTCSLPATARAWGDVSFLAAGGAVDRWLPRARPFAFQAAILGRLRPRAVRRVIIPANCTVQQHAESITDFRSAVAKTKKIFIEREPEYQQDIAERMRLCLAGPDEKRREIIKRKGLTDDDAGPLFGGAA